TDSAYTRGSGSRPVSFECPLRRFHLDDFGAHVRQVLHGGGALQIVAEIQNAHSLKNQNASLLRQHLRKSVPCLKSVSDYTEAYSQPLSSCFVKPGREK